MISNLHLKTTTFIPLVILDDLTLLCEHGFGSVLIEIDNFEAAKAIQERTTNDFNSILIKRIHQLLLQFDQCKIRHILREANQDVYILVKLAHYRFNNLCLYKVSPLGGMI